MKLVNEGPLMMIMPSTQLSVRISPPADSFMRPVCLWSTALTVMLDAWPQAIDTAQQNTGPRLSYRYTCQVSTLRISTGHWDGNSVNSQAEQQRTILAQLARPEQRAGQGGTC